MNKFADFVKVTKKIFDKIIEYSHDMSKVNCMFGFRQVYIPKKTSNDPRPICVSELFGNLFEKYILKPL